jgi:3-hydroxyisobutyrate dehydrogenase
MNKAAKIGFIGTGIMGGPMAGHLQKAGYSLRVFNRTREKTQNLIEGGAVWCDSPAAAARGAEVVFSMVGFPSDVESVILGENGVLSAAAPGTILIDLTTSEPALARKIYQAARAKNVGSLDAPVTGGDQGARNATLSIMAGGDREDFERARLLLEAMGKTVRYVGPAGAGQHTKMVNQILVAGIMTSMAEAFTYAKKAGLDLPTVLELVGNGAAGSPVLNRLGPRIIAGDWEPGFIIEHYIKDMTIALREAAAMNLELPTLSLARERYAAVAAAGYGRKGTQAIVKVEGHEAGVEF